MLLSVTFPREREINYIIPQDSGAASINFISAGYTKLDKSERNKEYFESATHLAKVENMANLSDLDNVAMYTVVRVYKKEL